MPLVALPQLIAAARSGSVVSFPTDTLPALAVAPPSAQKIFEIKQRSLSKPLILMGAAIADFEPYWRGTPLEQKQWRSVMEQHWPGALTLVLPIDHPHGQAMNPQNPNKLGFRIPNAALPREILQGTGPLATTSANRSGQEALQDLVAIAAAFPKVTVLDPTEAPPQGGSSGIASTVAEWNGQGWNILRQGSCRLET